jgi:hypothetical protein
MGPKNLAPTGVRIPVGASGYTDYSIPAAISSGYPESLCFPEDKGGIFLLNIVTGCRIVEKNDMVFLSAIPCVN